MPSIRVSEKHGVNPSVVLCFYCGEASGVALLGRLPNDAEAPRQGVFDYEPCVDCKNLMAQGVMLLGVDSAKSRTGHMLVVKDTVIDRLVTSTELATEIKRRRVTFIDQTVLDQLVG